LNKGDDMNSDLKQVNFSMQPGEEVMELCRIFGISQPDQAPPRKEGQGPFNRLVLKNAMMIDGTGAPVQGPFNIVVIRDRIAEIRHAMFLLPPEQGDLEIDCTGKYVLPGFVDSHVHIGNPSEGLCGKVTPPEYIFKLWMAHGVTTVRECGALMGLDWTLALEKKSEANEITAPRIVSYPTPYTPYIVTQVRSGETARAWVDEVAKKGIKGIKLFGHYPEVMSVIYDECRNRGLRSSCHHTIVWASRVNALDSCRMGLTSMEHFLGLAEALDPSSTVQNFPPDYNYENELMRALQDARMWRPIIPGSQRWKDVLHEMLEHGLTIVPTLSSWEPGMDVMRYTCAEWHKDYTLPALWRFFQPSLMSHWSFYYDWTTAYEIEFKRAYPKWMAFINDYKNMGGRITAGSDSGFGMKLFGFDFIRELELLQEAGFHPLEVVRSATLDGAKLLGMADEIGSIEPGKKADLLVIDENPLMNFKVLYGTGHMRMDTTTGEVKKIKALRYTIKDGIVYDSQQLLADVAEMVTREREAESVAG
jgi:hypothetical protein